MNPTETPTRPVSGGASRFSLFRFEALLAFVLVVEILIFSRTGANFATTGNTFEILRLSTEIGLLALVLTPIILTGGIDLSVGSLLGLCAILFGKLWRDAGLPPWLAAVCTLMVGAAGGGLNALLITRLRLPPLIVTLGSFSLFRGLAEAITRGVDNFTGFPDSFLFLGQGYWFGVVPAQVPIFAAVALVLTVVGVYSTIAYSVTQRTREIGIRMALGARSNDVLRLIVREGGLLVVAGMILGLPSAFVLTRILSTLLFGVSAADPATYVGASLLLACVALIASYIPARQATRTDPMMALRTE